ncbi:MAG: hypothetical protein EAX96_13580 [Candidatus Lokiarchaeota archaeon]|nr:hypothetical protein [Candidatus Lokiarchaeota archaeon]
MITESKDVETKDVEPKNGDPKIKEKLKDIFENKMASTIDALGGTDSPLDSAFEKIKNLREKLDDKLAVDCELVGNFGIGGTHLLPYGITLEWGIGFKFSLQTKKGITL